MTDFQALIELLLIIALVIVSILLIVAIVLQPSQKTGLIGDATDIEKRKKRGAELFLYRATIVLIIIFFVLCVTYAAAVASIGSAKESPLDSVSTSMILNQVK